MDYLVLWPDHRRVTAETLIMWASDDVANEEHGGPAPITVEDAIAILNETGSVTLAAEGE